MFVARDEHEEANIITCPLPDCNHTWCKQCQQSIYFNGPKHSCDGTSELDHLMKQQGWKYCPCEPAPATFYLLDSHFPLLQHARRPSRKHRDAITCRYVGPIYILLGRHWLTRTSTVPDSCMQNVSPRPFAIVMTMSYREFLTRHFCYICGGLIVKSARGQEIKQAISAHYRNCRR
jgi:hypothetical protein